MAGRANAGNVDGTRQVTRFANPVNVAYRDRRLYVADFDNHRVRVIDLANYQTTTLIAQSGFQRPFALAFAGDGTLYVSTDNDERGGHSDMSGSIWRVKPNATRAELVSGSIGRPRGLAVLPDGRIAAADYAHHVIELIDPIDGVVTGLAGAWDQPGYVDGMGHEARFATPYGIAVRADGTLVVADHDNHTIRLVAVDGASSTLAGAGGEGFLDGTSGAAMFDNPQAVAIADNGDIFVTDPDNARIRRITSTGVETVAGNGVPGYRDDDDSLAAQFYGLEGLAVVPDGSMLYIADGGRGETVPYNRIRSVEKRW